MLKANSRKIQNFDEFETNRFVDEFAITLALGSPPGIRFYKKFIHKTTKYGIF